MSAAREGHVAAAKVLIDAGADINAQDRWGTRAIENAIPWDRTNVNEVLCLLLERGVDLTFMEALPTARKVALAKHIDRCRSKPPP